MGIGLWKVYAGRFVRPEMRIGVIATRSGLTMLSIPLAAAKVRFLRDWIPCEYSPCMVMHCESCGVNLAGRKGFFKGEHHACRLCAKMDAV